MNKKQKNESELIVDQLRNDAIQRLRRKPSIAEDYRRFLERHSQGLCDQCGEKMGAVTEESAGQNAVRYKFACGHSHVSVVIEEKLVMRESIGGYTVPNGKGKCQFVQKFFQGWSPSNNPNLPEGVNIESNIDRRNKKYKKKVIDAKTGKILKDQEQSLIDHRGYGSAKFNSPK